MEQDGPTGEPEKGQGYSVLERREILRGQLKCPQCGCGRMPESRYCLRCDAELPEIQRAESLETIAQKRWQARVVNWLVDLVPGLASSRVVAWSLLLLCAAYLVGPLILYVGLRLVGSVSRSGAFAALAGALIFGVCLSLLAGFLSIAVFVLGLTWLLSGEMWSPVEFIYAFADFQRKHWILLFTGVLLGVQLFSLIKPWRLFW